MAEFGRQGYAIFDAEMMEPLTKLRSEIFKLIKKHFEIDHENPEEGLNRFHELVEDMPEAEFNQKRSGLIQDINKTIDCGTMIYTAFEKTIKSLVGQDILVQKNCNLVLQVPNNPNPSEIHTDAPANSCYEVVVWVPLVDCYKTKAMYILGYQETKQAYKKLRADGDWGRFEKEAIADSQNPAVDFGQALMFSTAVLHGSEINRESETRVSLNIRYKNIFAPSGLKNQYQFFRQLEVSDLTKIGADLEFDVIKSKRAAIEQTA